MADLNYYLGPWMRDPQLNCWTAPHATVGLLDFGSLLDCALSPSSVSQRGIGLFCTPRADALPSEYALLDSGDCREIQVTDRHRDVVEAVLGVRIDALGMTLAAACAELFGAGDPTGLGRWKPLTPTREGLYEIHLGGHSQIFARPFQYAADPTWNKLRDLLRDDLDKHDKECKAEAKLLKALAKELRKQKKNKEADKADAKAAKVEYHTEKVLDAMCRKYRCEPLELSTAIKRGKAETTISDDFSGDLSAWTVLAASYAISGGRLQRSGGSPEGVVGGIQYATPLSASDYYAQFNCFQTSGTWGGPHIRFGNGSFTGYQVMLSSVSRIDVYKWASVSSYTLLGTNQSVSFTSGNLVKWDGNGSTITPTINGTGYSPYSDSSYTGYYAGQGGWGGQNQQYDNFSASDGLSAAKFWLWARQHQAGIHGGGLR